MAPGWLAFRLALQLLMCLVLISTVMRTIDSIPLYERRELLLIKANVDSYMKFGHGGSETFSDPLLCNVPPFLLCSGAALLRKRRRRGTRSGRLVRLKAWLARDPDRLTSHATQLPQDYEPCLRRLLLGRSLSSACIWLVPVAGQFGDTTPRQHRLLRHRETGRVHLANLRPLKREANVEKQETRSTKCALVNARSIGNKTFILKDFFKAQALDVLFLTETWTRTDAAAPLKAMRPKRKAEPLPMQPEQNADAQRENVTRTDL
ncbi:hypothetical protein WMY93_027546 [Mugilogobius chulae]|uniref:Uncharacterized protein n=1 Tax=Mugilogobius chulae TaxID=88201 RepID=A0AAW0MT99_9GOBI